MAACSGNEANPLPLRRDPIRDRRIGIKVERNLEPPAMARSKRASRHRRRPVLSWWAVAALALLLVAVPILFFNGQPSGDPLKIRRELRKF
jgi:hypothetical protein